MKTSTTPIEGLLIIEPRVFADDRGYFFETYHTDRYGLPHSFPFVQDNESLSSKGVLRGLHMQDGEFAQGKLVRVVKGAVFDVAVDTRPGSPSYGQWYGVELTGENKKQFWIPRGFAHGYLVLEDDTIFSYKCDNYYYPAAEKGIRFDDPQIGVAWPDLGMKYLVSEKDLALGSLASLAL